MCSRVQSLSSFFFVSSPLCCYCPAYCRRPFPCKLSCSRRLGKTNKSTHADDHFTHGATDRWIYCSSAGRRGSFTCDQPEIRSPSKRKTTKKQVTCFIVSRKCVKAIEQLAERVSPLAGWEKCQRFSSSSSSTQSRFRGFFFFPIQRYGLSFAFLFNWEKQWNWRQKKKNRLLLLCVPIAFWLSSSASSSSRREKGGPGPFVRCNGRRGQWGQTGVSNATSRRSGDKTRRENPVGYFEFLPGYTPTHVRLCSHRREERDFHPFGICRKRKDTDTQCIGKISIK